jgi:hypothetical protein
MREAVALAVAREDPTAVGRLHLRLAEIFLAVGHPQLAADHAVTVLRKFSPPVSASKAILRTLKYLYAAERWDDAMSLATRHLNKDRFADCRPQILYMAWACARSAGAAEQEDVFRRKFLADHKSHPLAADIHYADAVAALAAGEGDEADRLLEIIEYRFEGLGVHARAVALRRRIREHDTVVGGPGLPAAPESTAGRVVSPRAR